MKNLTRFAGLILVGSLQAQIIDTTFVIDAKKNCLLLSGTAPVNIRSIMVGVDSPNVFIPLETYQITLSGSANSGPFAGLEMPGVFVHYYDRDKAQIFRSITTADTITFVPPILTSRQYFYAWVTDRNNLNDNAGAFQLRLLCLTTAVEQKATEPPKHLQLQQNYPNPFNPTTSIQYTIEKAARVKLTIYNAVGQKVKTLVDETKNRGHYLAPWNGLNDQGQRVASGTYFYQLLIKGQSETKQMLILE